MRLSAYGMIYGHGMDDWFLSPDRSKENPVGKGKAKLFRKPAELEVAGIYDDFFFFFSFWQNPTQEMRTFRERNEVWVGDHYLLAFQKETKYLFIQSFK